MYANDLAGRGWKENMLLPISASSSKSRRDMLCCWAGRPRHTVPMSPLGDPGMGSFQHPEGEAHRTQDI